MQNDETTKPVYDLEERTFNFARDVRVFIKTLPNSLANLEDCKQLVRASGSIGANYIEANESLSKKDFLMRIKISRKEAKESAFWLKLIKDTNTLKNDSEITRLYNESIELKKIFSAILNKAK